MLKFREYDTDSDFYHQAMVLRDSLLRQPLGLSIHHENLENDLNDRHFCLYTDELIKAHLMISAITEQNVKLRQMLVVEEMQGRGLGKRLINKVEELLKSEGKREISLHARYSIHEFYLSCGYNVTGDRFHEVGIPHIKMMKKLV